MVRRLPAAGTLDRRVFTAHMAAMLIQTETTPNPAALKFLPGRKVMDAGTRDFATPEAAEASPLAEAIFSTGEVEGVFFGRDFVSVTAAPGVDWRLLKPQVIEVLLDHFIGDAPLFRAGSAAGIHVAAEAQAGADDDPADAEVIAQIRELIETRVRPAVAQDGGDIVYRGFRGGTVYLALQGACSGCPSSTMTLKNGIESLLKHYVPEVEAVEAV
jgi:Fe-S cluster biogenesis protein NfuA